MIFWAGKSSDDVRVIVEHYPARQIPARKLETVSVPGRNGDLVFDEGAYKNYIQPYDIYISAEQPKLQRASHRVAEWLCGVSGYQKLEDSYDIDVFRLAYFAGPLDVENILNSFGRATIEFNCKPQRFFYTGLQPVRMKQSGMIRNPYAFPSQPLIKVYGSGSGTLQVGRYTVSLLEIDEYIVLDSEMQNAYKGVLNQNYAISAELFPLLEPGNIQIEFGGGVDEIEIIPNWWTL